MRDNFPDLGRCVSILDRLMKMYYDHGLTEFEIGWGQQFYAEYIYDHPGASAQDMIKCIRVDKATLTKIIKKLTQIGYVQVVCDEKDRRVKRLYPTEKAAQAVARIKEIHREFNAALRDGIPDAEFQQTERTLEQIMENVNQRVWHRMEENPTFRKQDAVDRKDTLML